MLFLSFLHLLKVTIADELFQNKLNKSIKKGKLSPSIRNT